MIGRLRGKLLHKQAPYLMIEVNGIGYELEATMSAFYDLPTVGSEVTLYTHLIVREDAHLLYGFANHDERAMFRSLIKVNGVGAKLALTILSGISVDALVRCVRENDSATLVRLPGVGKKTAERLIIEMRDRLGDENSGDKLPEVPHEDHTDTVRSAVSDAVSALIALGYKPQEASRMVRRVEVAGMDSEMIIRSALQTLVENRP
jgi:Holliday junction DNA helicase RuvA